MKTQRIKLAFSVMILAVMALTGGCALPQMVKAAKDHKLAVDPNPLEVHADTVRFSVSAQLPPKILKKGKVFTVNSYYRYGTEEVQLKDISFAAEDYPNNATETLLYSEDYMFPYKESMGNGSVEIKGVASNPKTGAFRETERLGIADGLITTSRLVQPSYYVAYTDHGYNDQEELIPTNVEFFFDQGRSVLKNSEQSSERGEKFSAFIAEKNVTKTVTITGTHSPEGKETFNSELSQERADAIEKWYREQMDAYDYQGMADEIRFILKPVVEDWSSLKSALMTYDGLSSDEKSEWNDIINGMGSFEQKEKELQKLSSYKKVFEDIYPSLRTAKTEVLTVKKKRSLEEIATKALEQAKNPQTGDPLTLEELKYAASKNPSPEEKKMILEAAAQINDTWAVHNNLGAAYMEMAMSAEGGSQRNMLDKALNHFNISNQKQANVEAQANIGMIMAMQGNLWGAHEALTKASSMSPNNDLRRGINGTKGYVETRLGRYDMALSSLGGAANTSTNMYNKGLVQVLSRDFSSGQATLENVIANDRGYVWAHYVAAVAAARQDNENKVIQHLNNALTADPSLKKKAMNDLEFRPYTGNQAFMDLVK